MKKIVTYFPFLLTAVFLVGCGAEMLIGIAASGLLQAGLMWNEGEATKYYAHDADTVYRATKRALREMNLEVEEDEQDQQETIRRQRPIRDRRLARKNPAIKGKPDQYYLLAGHNDRFKIKVITTEDKITALQVRINTMGDKPYAELLYSKVDKELGVIEFDAEGKPMSN